MDNFLAITLKTDLKVSIDDTVHEIYINGRLASISWRDHNKSELEVKHALLIESEETSRLRNHIEEEFQLTSDEADDLRVHFAAKFNLRYK